MNRYLTILLFFESSSLSLTSSNATFLAEQNQWYIHMSTVAHLGEIFLRSPNRNNFIQEIKKRGYLNFFEPSLHRVCIVTSSLRMSIIRDFADNFLQKVKYIVALYTMFSACCNIWISITSTVDNRPQLTKREKPEKKNETPACHHNQENQREMKRANKSTERVPKNVDSKQVQNKQSGIKILRYTRPRDLWTTI